MYVDKEVWLALKIIGGVIGGFAMVVLALSFIDHYNVISVDYVKNKREMLYYKLAITSVLTEEQQAVIEAQVSRLRAAYEERKD